MNELELKYGCNPNQKPARVFMKDGGDLPFTIDSHDVPGKPARGEPAHIHHDLQYLFLADPVRPLVAQVEEVHAAAWKPVAALAEIAPHALERLTRLPTP